MSILKRFLLKKNKLVIVAAVPMLYLLLAFFSDKNNRVEMLRQVRQSMDDNGKAVRTSLPSKTNFAFKEGEVLSYRVHYGFIDAGVAIIEVKPEIEEIGGRKVYHVVGNGYSKGTFDFFFKVRDRYESYIDKDALLP
ncbi:MAG: DUF3108 domain-containing protein, partial [Bacteroidetes bacterium]